MISARAILLVHDDPPQNRQDSVSAFSLGRDSERKLPEPMRKIIGDLPSTERVLVGRDLTPGPTSE